MQTGIRLPLGDGVEGLIGGLELLDSRPWEAGVDVYQLRRAGRYRDRPMWLVEVFLAVQAAVAADDDPSLLAEDAQDREFYVECALWGVGVFDADIHTAIK